MRGDAFIHFVCGSRRVNIRLGVLLLIPKSPQKINEKFNNCINKQEAKGSNNCVGEYENVCEIEEKNVRSYIDNVVEKRKISFNTEFHPIRMTYPIQPGPSFPASKTGERPNTLSSA